MYGKDVRVRIGVVTGRGRGENGTPSDPSMSGAFYLRDATDGPGVKNTDIPAILGSSSVNSVDTRKSSQAPNVGTFVTYIANFGERETATAMTAIPSIVDPGAATPGNSGLTDLISQFASQPLSPAVAGIAQPKEQTINGAVVRKRDETPDFIPNMLDGIPQFGAIFPLLGTQDKLPKQISTALDAQSDVLTPDMLSQLPGSSMNIGDLLSQFSPSQLSSIMDGKSSGVQAAIKNFGANMQSVQGGGGSGGFMSGSRVDPTTFVNNAAEMLKGVESVGDVVNVFTQLQSDTSLHGLDKLSPTSLTQSGPFGDITKTIDGLGNITNDTSGIQGAVQQFMSLIGSTSSLPDASNITSMFGDIGSGVLSQALNRLDTGNLSSVKELLEKVSSSGNPFGNDTVKFANMIKDLKGVA